MSKRYAVIFTGQVLPETSTEEVKRRLGQHYKLSSNVIERLFSQPQTTIKEGLDLEQATRLREAFRKVGAICRIQASSAPKASMPRSFSATKLLGELPPAPHIVQQVMTKVADPETSVDDLHHVISSDQKLAAEVLRIANSPFYGGRRSISNLSQAIVVLGFRTIRNLVVTVAIRRVQKKFGFIENLLWEHSVGCAVAAQFIARQIRFSKDEEAFLAGLLHDIGKTILMLQAESEATAIIEAVYNDPHLPYMDTERRRFGLDHAQIGKRLARHWLFPEEIEEAISRHHNPGSAKILPPLAHIVQLADRFCHRLSIGPVRMPEMALEDTEGARFLELQGDQLDQLLELFRCRFEGEKSLLLAS